MSQADPFDLEDIKARFPNRFGYCVRQKRFDKAVSLSGTMAKAICFVSTGECTFTVDSEELHLTRGEFLATRRKKSLAMFRRYVPDLCVYYNGDD